MFRQITFPDSDDVPPCPAQGAVYQPVAGFVALDFTSPPSRAVRRPRRVLGTAVPETTVNEDGETCLSKYEIRLYAKGGDGPPALHSLGDEGPGRPLILGRAALLRRLIFLVARQHGPTTNLKMSAPAANPRRAQQPGQRQFRVPVAARADARHDFGTFPF